MLNALVFVFLCPFLTAWVPQWRQSGKDSQLAIEYASWLHASDARSPIKKTERKFYHHFGKLFEVLGPATPRYNCIAWSLGITNEWVWPGDQLEDFDALNGRYGYKRIQKLDFSRQVGYDKIVLYGLVKNGRRQMTHQALQLADSSWSSKLGPSPLIRHIKPDELDGKVYGAPVAVYVRNHPRH